MARKNEEKMRKQRWDLTLCSAYSNRGILLLSCISQSTQTIAAGNSKVCSWESRSRAGAQGAEGLNFVTGHTIVSLQTRCYQTSAHLSASLLTNICQAPTATKATCQKKAKCTMGKLSGCRDSKTSQRTCRDTAASCVVKEEEI